MGNAYAPTPCPSTARSAARRLGTLTAIACITAMPHVHAEDAPPPPSTAPSAPVSTETIHVSGKADSQIGIADSAAQGTIGMQDLDTRPLLRVGEIMETIPGMIATEHSGGGKANQYYLRGYDLDHGTDFATDIDGVPVNLRTHAHGQGYSDLNFLIPETVGTLDYRKGPYYAQDGDFDAAGAADLHYADALPHGIASLTGGTYEYERGLVADSPALGDGHLLYALEAEHYNGPWDAPEEFRHLNGLLRYSEGDRLNGYNVGLSAYAGEWNATNQTPERAINEGLVDLYGNLSPSDGGYSQRYSSWANWHGGDATSQTTLNIYAVYYRLNLWSDFTFFEFDPVHGDQFEQVDRRYLTGGAATHSWTGRLAGHDTETTVGVQVRSDIIPEVAIFHTEDRDVLNTVTEDRVNEESAGAYVQNTFAWEHWLRSVVAIREDAYFFDVTDEDLPINSGTKTAAIASPKATLIAGPWYKTEYYLNAGLGFHSNDARGVMQREDPTTGQAVTPATPLVRIRSAEIGMRTDAVDDVHSTLGVFWVQADNELVLDADIGTTVPSGSATRRYGVEWSNYYKPKDWLNIDWDLSYTNARYTDYVPAEGGGFGRYIPDSIPWVATAGVTTRLTTHIFTTLRMRYFSNRPLNEDDTVQSGASMMVNARIGYQGRSWEVHVDLLNILNRKDADQSYYYQSQLKGEAAPVDDVMIHPAEPFGVRCEVECFF